VAGVSAATAGEYAVAKHKAQNSKVVFRMITPYVSAPAKFLPDERTGMGYNYLIAGQKAKSWL
jgi:hypothetical protein